MNQPTLTTGHKVAWGLLVLTVLTLIGAALWNKTHPKDQSDLDLSGRHRSRTASAGSDAPKTEHLEQGTVMTADELAAMINASKMDDPAASHGGSNAPKPEDLALLGQVKSFHLIDQHGKPIEARDLLGEVWVADFIFTHCAGTCPIITRQLVDLEKELADLPTVKFISFSMDPVNDTPEVLAKFAAAQGAESPRWKFLTGSKDEMYRMTRDEFKLVVEDQDGTKAEPIMHSTKIVLVDAQGNIRGRFDGVGFDGPNTESIKKLAAAVRDLRSLPPGTTPRQSIKDVKK